MTFFSTSERLEIGNIPFVSNNAKPTRAEALEYYRRVAVSNALNIRLFEEVIGVKKMLDTRYGKLGKQSNARLIKKTKPVLNKKAASSIKYPVSEFKVVTSKSSYTANHIIVATGFYDIPYLLNVPGEDLPKVKHYYDDPHFYAFQKVAVVGASNSAVDAALETWRKGADVTMIIRGPEVGKRVKYWVRPDVDNRIKEGSIKAFFNATVKEIKPTSITIQTGGDTISIPNDWVLSMTGYQPNLPFLKKLGIQLSKDTVKKPEYNEKTHESNVPGIYLAGVICGGMNTHRLFIENSRVHATNIIRAIKRKSKS